MDQSPPSTHGAVFEQQLHCHWNELQELVPEADDHAVQVLPHTRVQCLPLNGHLQPTEEDGEGLGAEQEAWRVWHYRRDVRAPSVWL